MEDRFTPLSDFDGSFNDLIGGAETAVLFFTAPWSEQCADVEALVEPTFVEQAEEVIRINVEKYQDIAARYDIEVLPTAICVQGGSEIARATGLEASEFEVAAQKLE